MPGFNNDVVYASNIDLSGTVPVTAQLITDGQVYVATGPATNPLVKQLSVDFDFSGVADVELLANDNVIYVGKHGNDANDGLTIGRAKLTIQAAETAAAVGDTIIVLPGTYTETITHTTNNVTIIGWGNPENCVITQADANVVSVGASTGVFYQNFKISCTAATTAINTVQVSTGSSMFRFCKLQMTSAAAIVAASQPSIGATTGAGTLNVAFGRHSYAHTGNCGGAAQKGAFKVTNGGLVNIVRCEEIDINNSGTALVSSLGVDLATTGNFQIDSIKLDVTDPNATAVIGFAYVGGTGTSHEFFRNHIHVSATNNTGYGFYSSDTATSSRFMYNHIHVTDIAGASQSFYIGNTSTVISQFDDIVAADGYVLVGGGTFTEVASEADGDLSVTNLTDSAVVIGGGSSALGVVGPLTDGQLVIGSTGVDPAAAALASAGGTVTITNGAGTINLETGVTIPDTFTTDVGNAIPALGVINVFGGNNIGTAGAGNTVTVNVNGTTDHTLQVGNATNSLTSLAAATNGQLPIGSTGADPVIASLTQPAAGITITGGAGSITFALADDLSALEALATTGIVSRTGAATWVATTVTQHAVLIGDAGEIPAFLGPLTNGQLVIGSTGVAPVAASLASAGSTVVITAGAGTINLETGVTIPDTFTTDAGNATPALGVINILGGNNIGTVGAAATVTVNVNGTTNHTVQVGNATASLTSLAAATNGQLIIGSTGADPAVASLASADGSVTITPGAGTIDLAAAGGGLSWALIAVNANIADGNGYIANKAGVLTMTLPAASAVGEQFAITNINQALGWSIAQGANQYIRMGNQVSTVGAGGSLASSALGDSIYCVCTETDLGWIVINSVGNITVT